MFSCLAFGPERRRVAPRLGVLFAVVSALCAFPSSALAYRTAGDTPDFAGTERVRWDPGVVPFVLYNAAPDFLPVSQAADTFADALATWQEPLCSALRWGFNGITEFAIRSDDRINTVQWVDDWEDRGFRSDQAAITDLLYAQSNGGDFRIVEADIYLNSQHFHWSLHGEVEDTRSLLSVLTHELGHAAGLLHPCEPGGDIATGAPDCDQETVWETTALFPLYSTSQAQLSTDDEDGLCFLYPAETCEQTGCSAGLTCTELGCQIQCGDTLCSLAEECVDDACVDSCRDPACQLGKACETDGDCHDSLQCVRKHCQAGSAPLGDPCSDSGECNSFACINRGYCAQLCEGDEDCEGNGSRCRAGTGTARACQTQQAPLGDPCQESDDCLGEQCIAGYGEPVCTRRCGEDYPECPLGWSCELVEGRSVCTPPFDGERGCTLAASNAASRTNAARSRAPSTLSRTSPWHAFGAALGLLTIVASLRRRANAHVKGTAPPGTAVDTDFRTQRRLES